jgi:polysaccharide deacetylase 2 family uncharacterized protein YibQ
MLALGMLIGAGLAAGLLAGWRGQPAVPPASKPVASAPERAAPRPHPAPAPSPPAASAPAPRRAAAPPRTNPESSQSPAVVPGPETAPGVDHPVVAVIFDDAGYNPKTAEDVIALPRPVTISVLPRLPFSTPIAEEAEAHGVQVLLHLPLQPDNAALELGPGFVMVDMSDETIGRTVVDDLATVPGAVGANNHMGSRGTSDPRVMRAVLGVVRARGLFFVDSLTSPRSVAAATARAMRVPTAVRAVFLDNQDDDAYVRNQFHELIRAAQAHGSAIAIGHVGKVTARVLRDMLPEFDEAGIRLVPVSALVH